MPDSNLTEERIAEASAFATRVENEMTQVVVGQAELRRSLLVGLLADGHVLLEGVPGLAKSLVIETLARCVGGTFRRLQFTPDLLPSDLVGTEVFDPQSNSWSVREGPVFANFVLADEINRAPAKVQSALLEAMAERRVSIAGETHVLPSPFLVLATQNPVDQEGTYPLPEAQLDRFMLKVIVDYPERDDERTIVERMARNTALPTCKAVTDPAELLAARALVDEVFLDDKLLDYLVDLVRATREPEAHGFEALRPFIQFGASPRASISLAKAAKAEAFLSGRSFVLPEDIRTVGPAILAHRIATTYEAAAEEMTATQIAMTILGGVAIP